MNACSFIPAIFILSFCSSSLSVFAQPSPIDKPHGISPGLHKVTDLLRSLHEAGIPLAYSSDKMPNVLVTVKPDETTRTLLKRLQNKRIIKFSVDDPLVIVKEYVAGNFTVSGRIKNSETGEYLIGATVKVDNSTKGTITNGYGFYSMTMTEGTYFITISHVSHQRFTTNIELNRNINLNIALAPATIRLEEVEINNASAEINILSNIPSVTRINMDKKQGQIPYLLGAVDIIQHALLLPGMSTVGEDAGSVNVRGGRPDQNLVLLDEAAIYNPNHYIQASVFNPDAVNDVKIFKGYIPPSYGGRNSSVIEVRQKEGNTKKFSFYGGIGPFSGQALAEGPFNKGKSSFLVSIRRSLLNLSTSDFASTSIRRNRFLFQDVNFKINLRPDDHNSYYLSGYWGNDRKISGLNTISNWGNRMISYRWNHIFTPRLFSVFSFYASEYSYKTEGFENAFSFASRSKITDYSFKSDLTYSFNPSNEVNFGFSSVFHRLNPDSRILTNESTNTTSRLRLNVEHGIESALYGSHEAKIGNFRLNYGLRYSLFHNIGPNNVRVYEPGLPFSDSSVTDIIQFKKNELIRLFHYAEPRISLNWVIDQNNSIKSAYSKTVQYLHQISNTLTPAPTDTWKLSDRYVLPSITHQYIFGYYKNFKENMWESGAEVYYKKNIDNISYKQGAELLFNENIETEIVLRKGRSYGLELSITKKQGDLTGWISYTLSRSEMLIDPRGLSEGAIGGKYFLGDDDLVDRYVPANFDRTHNFSTSCILNASDRVSISANFQYATGIPVVLPSDKYVFEGNLVPYFGALNFSVSRLPDYHRLDFSLKLVNKRLKKNGSLRKNKSYWVFSLYNVYARKNANSFLFRSSGANSTFGEIVQYSLFGTIIPGVTYNFRF